MLRSPSGIILFIFFHFVGLVFIKGQTPCGVKNVALSADPEISCGIPANVRFSTNIRTDTTPVVLQTEAVTNDFQEPFSLSFPTGNNGCWYALRISGLYSVWSNPDELIDPVYRVDPITNDSLRPAAPEGLVIPTPAYIVPNFYNPDHEYWFFYPGNGNFIDLTFADRGQYQDNFGRFDFDWSGFPCFDTLWYLNSQPFSAFNGFDFTFDTLGVQTVRLEVRDRLQDCALSSVVTVEIAPQPEGQMVVDPSCENEGTGFAQITMQAGTGPFQYLWSNQGPDQPFQDQLLPGDYTVTVTDSKGCKVLVAGAVGAVPSVAFEVAVQAASCLGVNNGSLMVENHKPSWMLSLDGFQFQSSPLFANLAPGDYTLYLLDSLGCRSSKSVTLGALANMVIQLPGEVVVDFPDAVALSPQITNSSGNLSFLWEPPTGLDCTTCANVLANPDQSTTYLLTVEDANGCQGQAEVLVKVLRKEGDVQIYFPTAFSPNYDGINDYFTVYGASGSVVVKRMLVFDRWGGLIFENTDFEVNQEKEGWDGTCKGKEAEPGIYVYKVEYEYGDGASGVEQGDLILVR